MNEHSQQQQKTYFAKIIRDRQGFSLIELMIALVITGIVASSFLGIMVLFSKVNQKSRTILLATAAANNQFERMKSYSLSELAQLPANQSTVEENFTVRISMERYFTESFHTSGLQAADESGKPNPFEESNSMPGEPFEELNASSIPGESNGSILDLVIKSSGENGFLSYIVAEDLQELVSLTGSGPLSIGLIPEDGGILVQMSDMDGKTAAYHFRTSSHSSIFNLFTQQMSKDQQVQIEFDRLLPGEWKINVYEQPFPSGKILFTYKDEVCQTNQRMKQTDLGELSIQTIKQDGKGSALVYLQVEVYTDPTGRKPVSACRGVIKVPY